MDTSYTFDKWDRECADEAVRWIDALRDYVEEVLPLLKQVQTSMQSPCDPEELLDLLNEGDVLGKTMSAVRYLGTAAEEINRHHERLRNA